MDSLLRRLGVYAWDDIEDLLFSGYIGEYGVLVVGETGSAKTLAAERIGEALDRAFQLEGGLYNEFDHKYRNASTAQVEDLIGYPMPLSAEEAADLREKGERPRMQIMLSQDSIIDAHQMTIDEINRCPPMTQNKWFSLVNERRVDGEDLENLRHVIGLMNPVHKYEGTEVLDRALADRFNLLIKPITLKEMGEADADYEGDMHEIAQTRMQEGVDGEYGNDSVSHGKSLRDKDCLKVKNFIEEGQAALSSIESEFGDAIAEYAVAVSLMINETIGQGPNTQGAISSRRLSMIAQSISGVYAANEVKGQKDLKSAALSALKHSFMHEVVGDDVIGETIVEKAHGAHKELLESKKDRLLSKINKETDRAKRVVMAINEGGGTEVVSNTINQTHNHLAKQDPSKRLAFSFTLFARLQRSPLGIQKYVNRHSLEELIADVEEVLRASQTFDMDDLSAHPSLRSSKPLMKLVQNVSTLKETKKGRAVLGVAAKMYEIGENGPSRSGAMSNLDDDSKQTRKYDDMSGYLKSAARIISKMVGTFEEIDFQV